MKKYIAYYRVSRKSQGISGLGLAAQKTTVTKYIKDHAGTLLQEFTEVETGTNKKERVEIHKAIELAKKEKAILILAKLDRLARCVNFVSSLMNAGVEFLACDMPSANNFTIHIFSALAEQEAKLISTRTINSLAELKRRGVKLGNSKNLTDEARAKGVEVIKAKARDNNQNRQAFSIILSCREKSMTFEAVAKHLNNLQFKTSKGNDFSPAGVYQLYIRHLSYQTQVAA
jgi:DNA invertase Pin-like site-specific DNA recombinase